MHSSFFSFCVLSLTPLNNNFEEGNVGGGDGGGVGCVCVWLWGGNLLRFYPFNPPSKHSITPCARPV